MDDDAAGASPGREIPALLRAPSLSPWQQNLYVLWFGSLVVSGCFSLVMPFLPLYLVELGLEGDPSLWSGVVLSGAFLGTALMSPVWGALADRYGQRAMLLRSGFSLAVVYALMGLVAAPWQLALLRIAFGMMSGFIPAATALVASNTPPAQTGGALGALQTGGAVGGVLGPLLGGAVAQVAGYRGAFFIAASGLALSALLAFAFVGERVPVGEAGASLRRFLWGLGELVRRPSLGAAFLVLFLMQMGLMLAAPVLPLVIDARAKGASALAVGFVYALAGLSQVVAAPFTAGLAGRSSYTAVLSLSLVLGGVLMLPQAWGSLAWLSLSRLAFGVAVAWATVSLNVLVARAAPPESRGRAFGLLNSVNSLGSMAATLLGGVMGDAFGWAWPIAASGVVLAAAGALTAAFARRGRFAV
ncbi:MAG: MFS transporter [Clostridia bacterium]|nr:MFS transporter [Clostridia bacterium]